MVFPVVRMDVRAGPKETEHRGSDAFELRCWKRLLRVPWTVVNTKGNQPWIFIERTDTEDEAPIIFPPGAKNWLTGKDPDTGKDGWQEEKEMAEDETVGWYHRLNGHQFEQAPGDAGGQGSLMCYSPCGLKDLDMTEWLNLTEGMRMCYVYNITIMWSLYIGNIDK